MQSLMSFFFEAYDFGLFFDVKLLAGYDLKPLKPLLSRVPWHAWEAPCGGVLTKSAMTGHGSQTTALHDRLFKSIGSQDALLPFQMLHKFWKMDLPCLGGPL